jgi:hypothetical protein
MTTGEQTIHMVSGETITYRLDLNERIAEAIGEVPEQPDLIDVMGFGVAALTCLTRCTTLRSSTHQEAIHALQKVLDAASLQHDGHRFL